MKKLMLSLMLGMSLFALHGFAGELDDEGRVINAQNPAHGTVVVRVDTRDNSAAVLNVDHGLSSKEEAVNVTKKSSAFKALKNDKVRSELDQDGGASSWYFYNPGYNWYNSSYCYYGNYYRPYYYYSYNYYAYYYYGSYYGNGWW
jgi:hypothetical protein